LMTEDFWNPCLRSSLLEPKVKWHYEKQGGEGGAEITSSSPPSLLTSAIRLNPLADNRGKS
jgi:hypothetical protein